MGIGSIGFPEILVIIVLALVFFGPNRMPEMARALGKAMREFRKGMNEVQRELEQAGREDRASKWDSAAPRPAGRIDPGREEGIAGAAGPAAGAAADASDGADAAEPAGEQTPAPGDEARPDDPEEPASAGPAA